MPLHDAERPVPYVYRPYPAHVHKAGGVFKVVQNEDEKAAALADGWWPAPVMGPAADPVVVDAVEAPAAVKRGPGRPRKVRETDHG